jgi:hypothetical protein
MKFYKVTTPHTQNDINDVIMSMSSTETEYIVSLYSQISMVEYTDENGYECMFAILDDFLIDKVDNLYKKYSIKFSIVDLSKDVIFDNSFNIKYKNHYGKSTQKEIQKLIKEFKLNWVTKDDILDKILEKGINSLSKIDLQILKS